MRSASAILSLIRWHNGIIAAAGVLLGTWWAGGVPWSTRPLLAAAAAFALAAYANAFNDWCDRDIDRVAHPERPLPRGTLAAGDALSIARLAAVLGIALSALARPALGLLAIVIVALMHAYSRLLKARGVVGNVVVAVLASLPFLYGAWSVGRPLAALPLLALAIPLHFAREVAKDLEDADGDAPVRRTLPVVLGPRRTRVVLIAALLAFLAVLVPFASSRPRFALFIIPALVFCAIAASRVVAGRRGGAMLLKSAMILAMAALVVGT